MTVINDQFGGPFDDEGDTSPAWERGATSPGAQTITAHAFFPAIVGLWFAALFGLGMLVLPVATLESISMALRLPSVLSAAAPPLGLTARLLFALAAALGGGAAGLVLARQLRPKSEAASPRRRSPRSEAARRPISAREELGEDRLDAPLALPGRRRALSVSDDGARSEFLELAPLPGADASAAANELMPAPLELTALADAPVEAERPALPPEAESDFAIQWAARRVEAEPPAAPAPAPVTTPASPAAPSASQDVAGAPLAQLSVAQLVERFSLALETRPAPPAAPVLRTHVPFAIDTAPAAPAPANVPPAACLEYPAPSHPAPDLVPQAFRSLDATLGGPVDDADNADDELDTIFGLPLKREARPFDPPAGTAAPFTAPAGPTAPAPFAPPADQAADGDQPAADDDIYPSLLAMKSPFQPGREPVRIEDDSPAAPFDQPPPAMVVFPSETASSEQARSASAPFASPAAAANPVPHSRPDDHLAPVDNIRRPFDGPGGLRAAPSTAPAPQRPELSASERALREALEKLNRMSGAA
ncbi:MAG: hypothetical protein DI636_05040 [Pelagerythrobacter marensis]|nr:MAG: hypothetical protein DI636_05040 [Pelagerythrobacter marensis]